MLRASYFFFSLVWMTYALSTFHMNDLARHSIQLFACKLTLSKCYSYLFLYQLVTLIININ